MNRPDDERFFSSTKENKSFVSLYSLGEIYFDVSLELVTTKHLWKAARVSDLRATTTSTS